jgi:SagB-type dehydrogenase family enzyme
MIPTLPAVRPRWPGKRIDLHKASAAHAQSSVPDPAPEAAEGWLAKLLRERHSYRSFDDQRPITLAELSRFLDGTARILARSKSEVGPGEGGPSVEYAFRPYPSAGASYELELYLAVDRCEGLARGFYHYDAGGHALVPIGARAQELDALLQQAAFAMGAAAVPQILVTIAARFGRMSWKYSSIAYALILKDVGVLTQTLYLMTTAMGLGGCAIGVSNIDLFAKLTGLDLHVEGLVGQFALGRGSAVPGVA